MARDVAASRVGDAENAALRYLCRPGRIVKNRYAGQQLRIAPGTFASNNRPMVAAHRTDGFRRTGAGTLPPDLDFVVQGGVSHGEMCDWCGEDVAQQSALVEIIWIRAGPILATAFLHPACFDAWRSELVSSGGSD